MIKNLCLVTLTILPFLANSQSPGTDPGVVGLNPFRNDPNARMAYSSPYDATAEGSAFFQNQYVKMEVTLDKGSVFKEVNAKFNLITNELFFQADGQRELITSSPVKRIRFMHAREDESGGMDEVVLESFNSPLNTKGAPVYQVLSSGKAKLLKLIVASYSDVRKYPEGNFARVYKRKTSYFASIDSLAPVKVEKNKADVLALFSQRQAEMKSYIEKKKIKCKTEAELISVFEYYSSLN